MEICQKIRSTFLIFLLSVLLATFLQDVRAEINEGEPLEAQCRPYIEEALKKLETGDSPAEDQHLEDSTVHEESIEGIESTERIHESFKHDENEADSKSITAGDAEEYKNDDSRDHKQVEENIEHEKSDEENQENEIQETSKEDVSNIDSEAEIEAHLDDTDQHVKEETSVENEDTSDKASSDEATPEEASQNKALQDEARSDEAPQDETLSDEVQAENETEEMEEIASSETQDEDLIKESIENAEKKSNEQDNENVIENDEKSCEGNECDIVQESDHKQEYSMENLEINASTEDEHEINIHLEENVEQSEKDDEENKIDNNEILADVEKSVEEIESSEINDKENKSHEEDAVDKASNEMNAEQDSIHSEKTADEQEKQEHDERTSEERAESTEDPKNEQEQLDPSTEQEHISMSIKKETIETSAEQVHEQDHEQKHEQEHEQEQDREYEQKQEQEHEEEHEQELIHVEQENVDTSTEEEHVDTSIEKEQVDVSAQVKESVEETESEVSTEQSDVTTDETDAEQKEKSSEEMPEKESTEEQDTDVSTEQVQKSESTEHVDADVEESKDEQILEQETKLEEYNNDSELTDSSINQINTTTESVPEEELIQDFDIPINLRSRNHIGQLMHLDADSNEAEKAIKKAADVILRELKRVYENAIKPLETLYKYRDLSNRHFGDPEIFSKPLVLFMGPWSGGKSSIINYLLDNEYKATSLRTGAEPSPAYFNILMWGEEPEMLDGTQLAADWTFSGLQKFGQGLEERLKGLKLPSKLLEKINIVEIPGILEVRKQVSRVFPFNDACQWFIDRADIIFLVYDPSKLDVGPETEAILDQLKGREYQTRIILNKADQVKSEELMRVQGALIWNLSPLMSSAQPPVMYLTSLWSRPYEDGAPVRLLQAQERSFLRDIRTAIDKRIENKISSARRFAVRVRNHAKMVDCYLTTYYNHKSVFANKKLVSDQIIEHPQDYHIYEGLSTLTNISRYDLPDPDVYRDFFHLNPLYEFQQLSATCTYFRGCPINRLDVAIAYDLPELVGKYKKLVEPALAAIQNSTEKS